MPTDSLFKPRHLLYVLAVVAVLLAAGLWLQSGSGHDEPTAQPAAIEERGVQSDGMAARVEPQAAIPPTVQANPESAGIALPVAPAGSAASSPSQAATASRQAAIDDITRRLDAQRVNPHPDIAEIDKALADLERITGYEVIGGMSIRAMRRSLLVAAQIQKLQVDINRVVAKGKDMDDNDRRYLEAKSTELQAAVQQLNPGASSQVAASAPQSGGMR